MSEEQKSEGSEGKGKKKGLLGGDTKQRQVTQFFQRVKVDADGNDAAKASREEGNGGAESGTGGGLEGGREESRLVVFSGSLSDAEGDD